MNRPILLLLGVCSLASCATPQQAVQPQPAAPVKTSPELPIDPAIRSGVLDNGLRFFIRQNKKPENRAELRLVINAGSILEEDDQQGLAHFVEHMAFNGTAQFPKQDLVDYLERIGMRFGPDLNASTGFDETVYMLQVRTDSAAVLEKAFVVLAEWAHNVSFEDEEIDKERGVAVEEWRSGRGAGARMRDKQFPILLKGSQYANRLPIGHKAVLDTFHHDTLRRFYGDWYRPDLMAVIAVGDFEQAHIETLIRNAFSQIPAAEKPRNRAVFPVPDHDETLFAIASDPEATSSGVSLYFKHPVRPTSTIDAYRRMLVESFYNGMLNQRLYELTKQEDPPFLGASSGQGRFVRSKEFYVIGAGVRENGIERGLEAVLTEAARVQRHGFTASELARQKKRVLRGIEQAYRERDKTQSGAFASEYIRHFLVEESVPGIEKEYELYQELIPGIQLDEVNRVGSEWITDRNRVVMVNTPQKEGVRAVTETDLLAVMQKVQNAETSPYEEDISELPLVEEPPPPADIVSENVIPDLGVTEWTLGNGVRVIMKPTDFKNDQVLFTSFSPGGNSRVPDSAYVAAATATSVVMESGLGAFSQIELNKKLAGKVVRVSPGISGLKESVSGSASPEDLETMFQLVYLIFTAPRADSTAFVAFRERIRGMLQNREASPETAYSDTVQVTMAQYHHRARPWAAPMLDEMDLHRSLEIYKDRFADAGDFTFLFVGNFEPAQIKPLVQVYLGGLPALDREDNWRDVGIRPPKGVIEKTVRRGQEPKSQTRMIFTGPFEWNRQNRYDLASMTGAFRIKLREVLREDMGGTYGVGVGASRSRHPWPNYSLSVNFGCAPERVEELTGVVRAQIDSLKQFGLPQSYIDKVKEIQRRQNETDLKENRYWLNTLRFYYNHGEDPTEILHLEQKIQGLTVQTVQRVAQQYFDTENYVRVTLLPEALPATETP